MAKIKAKWVAAITVVDPDSDGEVELGIYKLETGGMVAIDGSYLEQDVGPVYSPFDKGVELELED